MRFLTAYSILLTAAVLFIAAKPSPNELTVQRINIVEPDGTLRMVISNHARLPGIITKGKEVKFDRPQAGMIFYNDEGSENGGSFSFDKYGANQIVQLMASTTRKTNSPG